MRIAQVITLGEAGGAQAHVLDLVRGLVGRHEALVVAGGRPWLADRVRPLGAEITWIPDLGSPIRPADDARALVEVGRALAAWRPDVVHAHSFKAALLARVAASALGFPIVVTPHGWNFNAGNPGARRAASVVVEAVAGRLCRRVVCVSEADRQTALRFRVLPAARLVTIHNGISDDPRRASPGEAAPVPVLTTVGRLAVEKDHETLLRALAKVEAPLRLDIIGDGPREAEVRALVTRLGLGERVRLLGHRDDIPDRLAASHAFALISHKEGFPISILEAMRAGLPVVASAVAGIPEAVADGKNGFLVPRRGVEGLADRLHWLATQPAMRARLGAHSRARYEAEFTSGTMCAAIEALYHEVRAERSRLPWRR